MTGLGFGDSLTQHLVTFKPINGIPVDFEGKSYKVTVNQLALVNRSIT